MKSSQKNQTLRKMRTVTGFALVGSVLTGAFLGWIPTPFDLRLVGASLGALAGIVTAFRVA
jgi:hypothetical protein